MYKCALQVGMGVNQAMAAVKVKYEVELQLKDKKKDKESLHPWIWYKMLLRVTLEYSKQISKTNFPIKKNILHTGDLLLKLLNMGMSAFVIVYLSTFVFVYLHTFVFVYLRTFKFVYLFMYTVVYL